MASVAFDGTFDDWRRIARHALTQGWHPSHVRWQSAHDAQQSLLDGVEDPPPASPSLGVTRFRLTRRTLTTLESAACYRDPTRWDTFYRLIWRLTHGEPSLMEDVIDRDVRHVLRMDKQIRRDVHKMHAFVRFREVVHADDTRQYIAWFEPVHDIVLRAAPFFVRRFPSMHWSILTPDISVHWNQQVLEYAPGVSRTEAPNDDELEALWTTYYANIFNPARLKTRAMCSEMPKRYWVNLPEAALIDSLIRDASGRVARFQPTVPKSQS